MIDPSEPQFMDNIFAIIGIMVVVFFGVLAAVGWSDSIYLTGV